MHDLLKISIERTEAVGSFLSYQNNYCSYMILTFQSIEHPLSNKYCHINKLCRSVSLISRVFLHSHHGHSNKSSCFLSIKVIFVRVCFFCLSHTKWVISRSLKICSQVESRTIVPGYSKVTPGYYCRIPSNLSYILVHANFSCTIL